MIKMKILVSVFLCVLALAMILHTASALYQTTEPWPTWRYNLARQGSTSTDAPDSNQSIWFTKNVYPSTAPIIAEGKVIVGGSGSKLYAFDETTGIELWQSFTLSGTPKELTYSNGVIYVGTSSGYVYSINATTGAKLQEASVSPDYVLTCVAVAYGKVFFGTYDGHLYAYNASTLQYMWQFDAGGSIYSSPAIHGDMLYFGSDDDKIYALNISNDLGASLVWSYTTGGNVRSTPCVGGGKVFVVSSTAEHCIYALNATTTNPFGELVWKWTTTYTQIEDPAFSNDVLYVTGYQTAYALRATPTSGGPNYNENDPQIKIWSRTVASYPGAPVVADQKMFFYAGTYDLYALDTDDSHPVWSRHFEADSLRNVVIADGRLFVSTYSKITCIGDYYPPQTYYYTVTPPGYTYTIKMVVANATPGAAINITRLTSEKKITYTLAGIDLAKSATNITLPNEMLGGPYTVKIGGGLVSHTPVNNGTHSSLYFNYYHADKNPLTVEITGTTVIPEFPQALIPTLLMVFATAAMAALRRKPEK
ncbi:PQQ-like beta-propeller repeat protein [Candidatus Bathyarchaeota archaeon]|nr:PQQ-like beta-propeller repeat protein [Candidatus Bathyarchaeota archaeon]